jgi:hypothetical protein
MKTSIRIAVVTALALSAILGAPQAHHATPQHSIVAVGVSAPNGDELCC